MRTKMRKSGRIKKEENFIWKNKKKKTLAYEWQRNGFAEKRCPT